MNYAYIVNVIEINPLYFEGIKIMKTSTLLKNIGLLVAFGWSMSSSAALIHEYAFEPSDPFADTAGNIDLTAAGTLGSVTPDSAGFVTFSGANGSGRAYLTGSIPLNSYNPFVLSIWFRIPTLNQLSYASIFSSDTVAGNGFQINFLNGWLSINSKASAGAVLDVISLASLTTNEWHLITVEQDSSAALGGKVWFDGALVLSTSAAFGTLDAFRLGVNRDGTAGFEGDISLVRIYDGENWNSAKQAAAIVNGPAIPEPMAVSFILIFGSGFMFLNRIFNKRESYSDE